MDDGSYANPRFLASWNDQDWEVFESEYKEVLKARELRHLKAADEVVKCPTPIRSAPTLSRT